MLEDRQLGRAGVIGRPYPHGAGARAGPLTLGRDMGPLTAPQETLEALRTIDADADLVHLEGAEWLLGVRQPNPGAQEKIQRQLAIVDPHKNTSWEAAREFELLQLLASGFRPIALYHLGERQLDGDVVTFGWIVEDFRLRDFNYRVRRREAEAEFLDAISLDEGNRRRAQVMADFAEAEGPSLFRHVMKRARGFWQRVAIPKGA